MNPKNKTYIQIKPEDLAKIKRRKELSEKSKIPNENFVLAEFAYYYGWEAAKDFINDVISIEDMELFVRSARKIEAKKVYDISVAMIASRSKEYDKLMKEYIQEMRL